MTYCTWKEPDGELALRVGKKAASHGEAHAVIGATFDSG